MGLGTPSSAVVASMTARCPPALAHNGAQAIGVNAEPRGAGMNKTHAAAHVVNYLGQSELFAAAVAHR